MYKIIAIIGIIYYVSFTCHYLGFFLGAFADAIANKNLDFVEKNMLHSDINYKALPWQFVKVGFCWKVMRWFLAMLVPILREYIEHNVLFGPRSCIYNDIMNRYDELYID